MIGESAIWKLKSLLEFEELEIVDTLFKNFKSCNSISKLRRRRELCFLWVSY